MRRFRSIATLGISLPPILRTLEDSPKQSPEAAGHLCRVLGCWHDLASAVTISRDDLTK